MRIIELPGEERPREKLLERGAPQLSDAELLAVFLGSGHAGRNAVEVARAWLRAAGGVCDLLDAPRSTRPTGDGPTIGLVTWCRLQAGLELGKRYLNERMRRSTALGDADAAAHYLRSQLSSYPFEVFACLFLDNRHRVIGFEKLFQGTVAAANVHPREVVRRCLALNAAAVIFAHNHPSGESEPSAADRAITLRLRDVLDLIDVRVLDHFVIGRGAPVSLARRGLI